jgi:hypothetical protein
VPLLERHPQQHRCYADRYLIERVSDTITIVVLAHGSPTSHRETRSCDYRGQDGVAARLGVAQLMLVVAAICGIGWVVSIRFAPETRGLSLQAASAVRS